MMTEGFRWTLAFVLASLSVGLIVANWSYLILSLRGERFYSTVPLFAGLIGPLALAAAPRDFPWWAYALPFVVDYGSMIALIMFAAALVSDFILRKARSTLASQRRRTPTTKARPASPSHR